MATGHLLMYPVSRRFLESLNGSHEMVSRARICTTRQTGISPTGTEVPILDGDVKIARTADVKRTCEVEVPGEFWDALQPVGVELFLERGIDFGDGTQEYVPLGYYRVQDLEQDRAPAGPIRVSGRDRNAQLLDHRRPFPVEVQDGTTHRLMFNALINAETTPEGVLAYRAFDANGSFILPITWTGYDPDTTTLNGDQVWEGSCYEFLAKMAESLESVLAFADDGTLVVAGRDTPLTAEPSWTVRAGEGGNLLRYGRSVTRDKTYNMVTAYGSDPQALTGYKVAQNNTGGPLDWQGPFGPVGRFYASPLLRNDTQALAAAEAVLARYATLPLATELEVVPNPALRPNDLVQVEPRDGTPFVVQVDELTIPLVNRGTSTVRMITQNAAPDDDGSNV